MVLCAPLRFPAPRKSCASVTLAFAPSSASLSDASVPIREKKSATSSQSPRSGTSRCVSSFRRRRFTPACFAVIE